MFSEEVKMYVIDNILSVDFFDVIFLDGLRKVLINSDPEYKEYVSRFFISESKSENCYQISKYIYLFKKQINIMMEDIKLRCPSTYDNIFTRNIVKLFIIMHEIEHSRESELINKGKLKDLLLLNFKTRLGEFKAESPLVFNLLPKKVKADLMYIKYHNIYPSERIANFESIKFLLSIYEEITSYFDTFIPEFKKIIKHIILDKYIFIDKRAVSPIEAFHLLTGRKFDINNYKELTEYERVMLGIEIDIDTINKVINEYIMKEENSKIKRR